MKDQTLHNQFPSVLITGSSGFLGRVIVKQLTAEDSPLKVASLKLFDKREETNPEINGLTTIRGDVRDYEAVEDACRSIDIVIHLASKRDCGQYTDEEIWQTNVKGTENVIRACKAAGVKYLIYTSSQEAVYGGIPLKDIDESCPYPEKHPGMYGKSKEKAEKMVTDANGCIDNENKPALYTMILRPSFIYGEADPYHMASLLETARSGFYTRMGKATVKCQQVYVENVAFAHIQAASELWKGNTRPAGNIYFITDGPGMNYFQFFDHIIREAGYRIWSINLWVPFRMTRVLRNIFDRFTHSLKPGREINLKLNRFSMIYLCNDFTFSSEKAAEDFGFRVKYPQEEAIRRTIDYYRNKREILKKA
ncbi:MAG: NAD-dependent epimerase/dehydratase family protein [Bacteroidota bacterium]|nr:NAD-dependent epimerase/dehydratase family protein [Bacteroidota bacterium]